MMSEVVHSNDFGKRSDNVSVNDLSRYASIIGRVAGNYFKAAKVFCIGDTFASSQRLHESHINESGVAGNILVKS